MSFYPILKSPNCSGATTLHNFPPNNWELRDRTDKYINITYAKNNKWHSKNIGVLNHGESKTIAEHDIIDESNDSFVLLSLTTKPLQGIDDELPTLTMPKTITPAWRATLTLNSQEDQTSYQGEIDPFPPKASLLTFNNFMQFGDDVENYVLLMNIEKKAIKRTAKIIVYQADSMDKKAEFKVGNNQINIIKLDNLGFNEQDLPIIMCDSMAFIPLYFSSYKKGELLSLEHTHPPASLVVHGNRFAIQRQLKQFWTDKIK